MNTSEVLNLAADLLEERGWATGSAGMKVTAGDPLCLMGAIGAAAQVGTFDGLRGRAYSYTGVAECSAGAAVADYLSMVDAPRRVYDFNDAPGRTASEVIEVLRATAVIEASREDAALLAETGRA